jgi:hypothetical protein
VKPSATVSNRTAGSDGVEAPDDFPAIRDDADIGPLARVFCRAWAIAALFDKAWYGHWVWSPTNFGVAATALMLLMNPGSALCLVLFSVAGIADYFSESTVMGNHTFIMMFVDAMIVLVSAQMAWRGEWHTSAYQGVFRRIFPALRWCVLAMYFWATVHKLNTDFLNPETSCVRLLIYEPSHRALIFSLFHPPDWMVPAGIHATLVIEAVILILLCAHRTRWAGLLLAFGFHSFLSFGPRNGFYAFSVVIFPLLLAFVDPAWGARMDARIECLIWPRSGDWRGWLVRGVAVVVLGLLSVFSRKLGVSRVCPAWFTYNALFLTLVVSDWWVSGVSAIATRESQLFRIGGIGPACLAALFFLNGLSPYVGLKTETSFAMYSNLRTEGNRPNHLFIPGFLSVFPGQDDLVEVLDCPVPELGRLADRHLQLPFFQLCSELSTQPEASIMFRRGAEVYDLPRVGDRRDLLPEIPLWKRRLFPFRALEPTGSQGCRH